MKAFELFINGHRFCLAGLAGDGMLNAFVNWVGRAGCKDSISLHIGGQDFATPDEHLLWNTPSIGVGAEILARVVEAAVADPPDGRIAFKRPTALEQCRECLRQYRARLTEQERRQLLRELIADLEAT